MSKTSNILNTMLSLAIALLASFTSAATAHVTLNLQEVEVAEVMDLLSKQKRVNILLSKGVTGKISVNLYNVPIEQAIRDIASAAGYAVEETKGTYFVLPRSEVGQYSNSGTTVVESFTIQYADAEKVEDAVSNYLSKYGKITSLEHRNMLLVEDTPEFLARLRPIINSLDARPQQILIETMILEITLEDNQAFGIEWSNILSGGGIEQLGVGTNGFSPTNPTGLFMNLVDEDLEVFLDALNRDGRTRTLSTPKLVALENEEASVIVGDRLGYLNTVTINQVTTESTQFLESGVILRVTPSVDKDGLVMLEVEPEVSTGSVTEGIPSQTTTTVKTQLLVPDGHTSFIGGLIKTQKTTSVVGVPYLSKIPFLGALFRREEDREFNTETIVLITPRIIDAPHLERSVVSVLEGGIDEIDARFKQLEARKFDHRSKRLIE